MLYREKDVAASFFGGHVILALVFQGAKVCLSGIPPLRKIPMKILPVHGQVRRKELNVAQSNNRQKRFLLQFLLCSQTFLEMHKEPNTSITITRTVSTYDQIQPKKGNILLSDCNLTCVDLHKWEKFFVLPHYNVTFPPDNFLTRSSFSQS